MKKPFATIMQELKDRKQSRIILALDKDPSRVNKEQIFKDAIRLITELNEDIISIKMNMHMLLPLSEEEISKINRIAHEYDITSIADIKLNDIPNTNRAAIYNLVKMGFDAVIINPFIGFQALYETIDYARLEGIGVITLVFMSHKGAENTYGLMVNNKRLYQIFLEWSQNLGVDGIVVGATYPDIIARCYRSKIPIYSPGISVQGGDPSIAVKNGVEYLIIGRKIINAENPKEISKRLKISTYK
ncbi:MAG: orotidine-5'-phosphate decarboxylase [Candidatus Nitrosocaldaceae archaeon]|nr:MAG: orotidine-5'-phosphate decarboxylase [Candidatus Nitrosocaldaceae archaeon]